MVISTSRVLAIARSVFSHLCPYPEAHQCRTRLCSLSRAHRANLWRLQYARSRLRSQSRVTEVADSVTQGIETKLEWS